MITRTTRTVSRCMSFLAVLLIAGCAAQQAFRQGHLSMQSRDYDRAYSYFKEATQRSPDNVEYRAALEDAKTRAERYHFAVARDYFTKRLLGDAETAVRRALGYSPANSDFTALLSQITEAMGNAQKKRKLAIERSQHAEWDSAINAIEEAISVDKSLADGQSILKGIKDKAANHYCALAKRSLDTGDLPAAEQAAKKSSDYVAGYRPSSDVLEEVRQRREADNLVSEATQEFSSKKYDAALSKLSRAKSLHPSRADIAGLEQQIREAYCRDHIAVGNDFLSKGDFVQAIENFKTSQEMLPNFGDVDVLIQRTCGSLSKQYRDWADRERLAKRWGNALLYALLANSHAPDHGVKERIDEAVAQIQKRVNYRVAVVGFKSALENQEPAAALESGLVEDILAAKPKNISVMDRADLDRVLAEQNLSATDLIDPTFAVIAGKLRGVNAIIVGQLSLLSIGQDKTSSNGSSNYQSGTRMVENPGYGFAEMSRNVVARNVAEMERDLAQSQQQLREVSYMPATPQRNEYLSFVRRAIADKSQRLESARRALAAEEARLASVPRMVQEPVILSHSYPVYHFKKTARMKVSVKMVDTETGEVLWSEPIDGLAEVSDRMIQPDPLHNVDGDPLDLPDDQEMRNRCVMNALERMRPAVRKALKDYGERYRTFASKSESLGHRDDALDQYVNYLFSGAGTTETRGVVLRKIDDLVKADPYVYVSGELGKVVPSIESHASEGGYEKGDNVVRESAADRERTRLVGNLATLVIEIPEYNASWQQAWNNVDWSRIRVELYISKDNEPKNVKEYEVVGPMIFRDEGDRENLVIYTVVTDFGERGISKACRQGETVRLAVPPGEYSFQFGLLNTAGGKMFGIIPSVNRRLENRIKPGEHTTIVPR